VTGSVRRGIPVHVSVREPAEAGRGAAEDRLVS